MAIQSKFGSDLDQAREPATANTPPTTASPSPADEVHEPTAEERFHDAVRLALLQQAQQRFATIASEAETGYSRDLTAEEDRINAFLKTNGGGADPRAVMLDPAKIDAGLALGMTPVDTVTKVLALDGVENANKYAIATIAKNATEPSLSRFGIVLYTHSAFSQPQVAAGIGVIAPSSDHGIDPIAGMTVLEKAEYVTRHEGWHAKSDFYVKENFSLDALKNTHWYNPSVLATNTEAQRAFVARNKDESFADVGAMGDMIRGGKNPEIIDKLEAHRNSRAWDGRHLTSLALEGLKQEINKMGIDKFRAMNDAQARDFYHSVVEKYDVNEAGIAAAAQYDMNPAMRKEIEAKAASNPEIATGLAFAKLAKTPASDDEGNAGLKPGEQAIKDALDKWDASKILQDKAFALGGKITPETMTRVYGALESDLRNQLVKDPGDTLCDLKMSKLETAFISDVSNIDYLDVNARRGVDILAVEPEVKQAVTPSQRRTRISSAGPARP